MRGALILGSIGALVAVELTAPPRTVGAVHESPASQTSAGVGDPYDTLTEEDRLEPYRYAQSEAPAPPDLSDQPTSSVASATFGSREPQKRTSRHSYSTSKQKVAVAPSKPRAKSRTSAKRSNSDRVETVVVSHKSCRQNVLDSFLKLLSLSHGCET
jgi:hypothetical protein